MVSKTMNFNNSLRAKRLTEHGGNKRPTVNVVVIHDTAGSGTVGDAKYLANDPEDRKVSVDFVILRDGEIYKLNPDLTRYTTNHAGRATRFAVPGTNIVLHNAQVNNHSIGIELAHNSRPERQTPEWPTEQVRACAELCKWLCDQFQLSKENITTHMKLITDRSRTDPRNFPWDYFWSTFHNNPVLPATTPLTHTVVSGDTLYALANKYHVSIEQIKALNHYDTPSTLITVGQVLIIQE
jgi:N-acetyl-anhydromuramyl-L-alanine amidase AmpD